MSRYFFNPKDGPLNAELQELQHRRRERNAEIIKILQNQGLDISMKVSTAILSLSVAAARLILLPCNMIVGCV